VGRHWKLFLLPHIPACMSMASRRVGFYISKTLIHTRGH
jgi:hypothetical protein